MDEEEFRQRLDELDVDLTGTHAMAAGSFWPSTAIACALIEKGVIDKITLLKIVDTLMATASAFAVTQETDPQYSAHSLEVFRRHLEQMQLQPGNVLNELAQIERGAAAEAARYHQLLKKQRREDRKGDPSP
ncbi:hypothetical protein SAMN05880590_10125 [Rhizobium sp. RU35A]|uniref:hypothetical protein n=1 Tax=Rhizobium sp. RU35A TaxID=1907414 RepID=UPI000954A970|nr:hypothetical protein [Rhizobium sp. RU35A]SIP89119.1 hypothetical protein SAMN05880590_10125 [Rhizobium sp. RU35A]